MILVRPSMRHRGGALLVAACLLATGCRERSAHSASGQSVVTVPLHVFARNAADYRGQTIRTCGREVRPITQSNGEIRSWQLRAIDPTSPHRFEAFVVLPACGSRPPRLEHGCVTGRIAREDNSLDVPDAIIVTDHAIGSEEWWLHPSCPEAPN